MKKYILYFITAFIFSISSGYSQTVLSQGDIAITGVYTDNPDDFSFVLLTNIQSGTKIVFTDKGILANGTFTQSEGAVLFTSQNAMSAGTVIRYTTSSSLFSTDVSSIFPTSTGNFLLSTDGDQVIAFQGTESNPQFLYAIQTNSTQWQEGSTNTNDSKMPPFLIPGQTAVAVGLGTGSSDESDNAWYSGTTTGSKRTLLKAISNPANWTRHDANYSPITSSFSVNLNQKLLLAGDIAIIGMRATAPDDFSFVLLKDLVANTKIYFTDKGVLSDESFNTSEGAVVFKNPCLLPAGTVIRYTVDKDFFSFDDTSVFPGDLGVWKPSRDGDQLLAFQRSGTNPYFLFGIQSNSSVWQTTSTNTNTSALPHNLVNAYTAAAVGAGSGAEDEYDNVWYTGATSGTRDEILLEIADRTNWQGSDSTYAVYTSNFALSSGSVLTVASTSPQTNIIVSGFEEKSNKIEI